MKYYGIQNEVKAYINRLQDENGIFVSTATVKTINDRVESLKRSGDWSRFSLGFNDVDGDAYLARAGVTDPLGRCEVLWFVRGMKALDLWRSMVCWPLRNYQNAGTGATVFSLGGLGIFNGTLQNSPVWNSDGSGIFFDQVVNYKRVDIPVTTSGWTQASLCGVFRSTNTLPFTLLVTLDNANTVNDATAKLALSIFQPNGQNLLRSMSLTGGTLNRFVRMTPNPTPTGYNYYFGQTDNIYDPVNANFIIQQNNSSGNTQEGTGTLPYTTSGTNSFLFNTYGTTATRADTAAFAGIFRRTLGLNTSNLFRQLFRQTIGSGLNLPL
jgi:hypothetical protein